MKWKLGMVTLIIAAFMTTAAATPAQASPTTDSSTTKASWDCDGDKGPVRDDPGGRDAEAWCIKYAADGHEVSRVYARFDPYGENFQLCDDFPNGHKTVAYLSVKGNGTSTYYTKKNCRWVTDELSFDEGLAVTVKVCTSNRPKALCHTQKGGIT